MPEGGRNEGASKLFAGGFQGYTWQETENRSFGRGWRVRGELVYGRGNGGCAGTIAVRDGMDSIDAGHLQNQCGRPAFIKHSDMKKNPVLDL